MEIKKTQIEGTGVLNLVGRLDVITSPKLQESLLEIISESQTIELDFSEVAYVSSAGLRVLLLGEKNAKASGKTMSIKNVPPKVLEVFQITGLAGVLTIV